LGWGRTIKDKTEVVKLYKAGWRIPEIVKFTGIPYTTCRRYILSAGIKLRPQSWPQRLSPEEIRRTVELYETPMSLADTARALGLKHGAAVKRRLDFIGHPQRGNAGRTVLNRRKD